MTTWMWRRTPPFLVRKRPQFPLLSLPPELITIVLSHLVYMKFKYFRNTLTALPELKELVICLTNCTEVASEILKGVQCVLEHEYVRIMSSPSTKKPFAIMIISPYIPHRGEQLRSLASNHIHPLLDHFHSQIRNTVVEAFISLDPNTHRSQGSLTSDQIHLEGLKDFTWLKKFPSACSCPQPTTFPSAAPKGFMRFSNRDLTDVSMSTCNRFIKKVHKEVEQLWIIGIRPFPGNAMAMGQSFPRLKHLDLDIKNVLTRYSFLSPINCRFRLIPSINIEAPVLQTLTVNFLTLLCPCINHCVTRHGLPSYIKKSPGKEVVVRNLHWTLMTPYGLKKGCQSHLDVSDHDDYHCSTEALGRPGVTLSLMFESLVLMGVPDTFLVRASWECVTSVYWKRLEPAFVRHQAKPSVVHCPSLKHLKIFHLVSNKVPLIKFDAPVLEQLVLVSLPGSDEPWDVLKLVNHQWPQTLCKLTISAEDSANTILPKRTTPPEPLLTHLWIQRLDLTLPVKDIIFKHLVYLDLDVTAIAVTRTGTSKRSLQMIFNRSQYPVLNTLVLSMPLRSNKEHSIGAPVSVLVPETCQCIGVATALSMRSISANGKPLQIPPKFVQTPYLELFTRYMRELDGDFVANGQMMAERGEPLDLLFNSQQRDFDHERRHCI